MSLGILLGKIDKAGVVLEGFILQLWFCCNLPFRTIEMRFLFHQFRIIYIILQVSFTSYLQVYYPRLLVIGLSRFCLLSDISDVLGSEYRTVSGVAGPLVILEKVKVYYSPPVMSINFCKWIAVTMQLITVCVLEVYV